MMNYYMDIAKKIARQQELSFTNIDFVLNFI